MGNIHGESSSLTYRRTKSGALPILILLAVVRLIYLLVRLGRPLSGSQDPGSLEEPKEHVAVS